MLIDSMLADNEEGKIFIKQQYQVQKLTNSENGSAKRHKSVHRLQRNGCKDNECAKLFRRSSSQSDRCHQSVRNSIDSQDSNSKLSSLTSEQLVCSDDSEEDLRLEKTGWLNVKHWLTVSDQEIVQLAPKQSWKRFWIWLKECHLHIYNDYLDKNPHLILNMIDGLCYPYPEYRHRQNVFSLTVNTGDIYLLQSCNQIEIDQWIDCIHSNCLLKLNYHSLQTNIRQLENQIVYERKMLQTTCVQLKLSTNDQIYSFLSQQIEQRERDFERFCIDLFRNNCYLTIFPNNSNYFPNSTDLLAQITSTTKFFLCGLDAFTPCGLYTYVLSRQASKHRTIYQTVLYDSDPQRVRSNSHLTIISD
ncbi:unnamed protein product [Adineta ricciae]|uniref:PH domain-containing protein n=1 Tax=Adineta ricciae TaxID=249248 RepID=A0A814U5R8_ADIRI|nr:unnamed protein product [Adineta ricciae]